MGYAEQYSMLSESEDGVNTRVTLPNQRLIDRGILEYYMRRVFGNDLKIKAQIRGEGEFIDANLGAFLSCVPDYDVDMETFVSELKDHREIKMKGMKKVNYTTG